MFADRLSESIKRTKSFVVAGFDPNIESFPKFILNESQGQTNEDTIYRALLNFYTISLEVLSSSISSIKPNIAFFEQYGISGLRAFSDIARLAHDHKVPVIADVKRGDIGTTAQAYSNAYLGKSRFLGKESPVFDVDAITVNPFLGFDTLDVFIKDCEQYGKGIFVLVKTSNPGSGDIQNRVDRSSGRTISESVAEYLARNSHRLKGDTGFSGLGAVVGATYPDEMIKLRSQMPNSYFLIPGMGSQGGTARDVANGFVFSSPTPPGGAVINLSRALLSDFSGPDISKESFKIELKDKISRFNAEIDRALQEKGASS